MRHNDHTGERNKMIHRTYPKPLLFFTLMVVHSNTNFSFGHGINVTLEATGDIFWWSMALRNSNVGISGSILWRVPV